MIGISIERLKHNYILNFLDILTPTREIISKFNWGISLEWENEEWESIFESSMFLTQKYVFVEGEKLIEIMENKEIQFIWSVFSAFPKSISVDRIMSVPLPFVEYNEKNGYSIYYETPVLIQHALAEKEIVVFDSSYVYIIEREEELIPQLKSVYKDYERL
ncbi:hypothetical protein SAMN02745116_01428 [Pilibacter termitis]|uniref:Uncharacterized protein n=1 Tax=Pilibacter termitis TaxID=263852 RepID=A0A1T4NJF6_9ENTE|nr:hypothetical protein [Pilibacter termitis]SJZ78878.1 hypothetical protein SAMN02745116_01428 [Pilibacter termitis]